MSGIWKRVGNVSDIVPCFTAEQTEKALRTQIIISMRPNEGAGCNQKARNFLQNANRFYIIPYQIQVQKTLFEIILNFTVELHIPKNMMKYSLLVFSLLLIAFSCRKKVVPAPLEQPAIVSDFIDLHDVQLPVYPDLSLPGLFPSYCNGLDLDGDTSKDFQACKTDVHNSNSEAYTFDYLTVSSNYRLETIFDTNATKRIRGIAGYGTESNTSIKQVILKYRYSGDTVYTRDTSVVSNVGYKYYYYRYAYAPNTIFSFTFNASTFNPISKNGNYYIVLRKIEGSKISIGYIELNANGYHRFRKFKEEDRLVLP